MCGIVGYIGHRQAQPIITAGLEKLEYRGYDSAGICTVGDRGTEIRRSEGKLSNLSRLLEIMPLPGKTGIGHTRWATHGRPSETNAHPHQAGPVVLVHNGIIENHVALKELLRGIGHTFKSETDTEVIAHLIEQSMKEGRSFEESVRRTLRNLKGAYALCIVCVDDPDLLIAAKNGSPLVVGIGEGEYFVASDIPAILAHTREFVFMEDGEIALFRGDGVSFSTLDGEPLAKSSRRIDWTPVMAEKGGYRHFMLKEIFEQPRAVQDTLAGRLREEEGDVYLEDLAMTDAELRGISRICIVACGTSWHSGLVGKFYLEEYSRIPVEVDIASEFRYRNPVIGPDTLLIAISQSGETADTLAALREARNRGGRVISICNAVDSSIARESDGVIYTHAGPEIGVASTKAFVTQLVALYLLTIRVGRATGAITRETARRMLSSLVHLPRLMEEALRLEPEVEAISRRYCHARDFLYLGRGTSYPLALEGALKMKEISYIHAEGYPAGEMKHGPIALIDENLPVVVLAPSDRHYGKVVSNLEEVRARGGRVIGICSADNDDMRAKADAMLVVPPSDPDMTPLVLSVPLQLMAYHVSVLMGNDVDQPRNLAKSVTVE